MILTRAKHIQVLGCKLAVLVDVMRNSAKGNQLISCGPLSDAVGFNLPGPGNRFHWLPYLFGFSCLSTHRGREDQQNHGKASSVLPAELP